MDAPYNVRLEVFEGPLDLLLHLVRKNRVNIYDIPVALILDQYLGYLDVMESLDIDVAGEFVEMAATLAYIKSRMLLPSAQIEEEEEEDPRRKLVRSLILYARYREASEGLDSRFVLGRDVFTRRSVETEEDAG